MPPQFPAMLIPAVAFVLLAAVTFGFPALAVVAVKFFRYKERELQLELEFRHKSQHQALAVEQRVQRLEDVVAELDRDVRERLGIERGSPRDLFEAPATAGDPTPARQPTKVR